MLAGQVAAPALQASSLRAVGLAIVGWASLRRLTMMATAPLDRATVTRSSTALAPENDTDR